MAPSWMSLLRIEPQTYICGYCGKHVSSKEGYHTEQANNLNGPIVTICPGCNRPSYFRLENTGSATQSVFQTPAPMLGNEVSALPPEIASIYREARLCTSAEAYTSCVLICRKLLMHIAVERGATAGLRFIEYVDYLNNNHYVPPNSKDWVDHIRSKGNEANHEIVLMSQPDALELLSFIEMLLKFIYEFPARMRAKTP